MKTNLEIQNLGDFSAFSLHKLAVSEGIIHQELQ